MEQKAKNTTVLYADETSWYVGSPNHYLWSFGNPQLGICRVVENRKRENIEYMIGGNYKGVLVSDCLVIYDGVNEIQQKCYAHHLKEIKRIMRLCDEKSKGYLRELRMLLKAALILKSVRENIRSEQYDESIQLLEHRSKELLGKKRNNTLDEKVANRLRKQQDHLFTFLKYEVGDATNNLAERMLRPAVISRRISCGNKTPEGAETWQVLTSIIQANKLLHIDNQAFLRQKSCNYD